MSLKSDNVQACHRQYFGGTIIGSHDSRNERHGDEALTRKMEHKLAVVETVSLTRVMS